VNDVLPVVVGVVLIAAAAVFALLPFARQHQAEADIPDSAMARERALLYRQVLELDFDRQLGKLSEHDYRELSSSLLARAGDLLRAERGALGEMDDEIEREIAAARAAFAAARRPRTRTRRSKRTAEPVS
jgi:hypothetical protein